KSKAARFYKLGAVENNCRVKSKSRVRQKVHRRDCRYHRAEFGAKVKLRDFTSSELLKTTAARNQNRAFDKKYIGGIADIIALNLEQK
ncbi:MAG: hypothetical protein ACI4JZ_03945, partial [Oscillospiraceae bacterium]